ncbi:MAG: sugar ABC transporter permease [Clostridiales bacterium]|nr:sugar ABC transporter permease [Clostridiales bacterium]
MSKNKAKYQSRTAYMMIAPAVLIIFGMGIFPVCYSIWLSFNKVHPMSFETDFIGLQNYSEIFANSEFWQSIGITLYFCIVSIAVQMVLGVLVAMLLNQRFVGRGIVRALILLPWAVPTIVNANLWNWILNANYGILNRVLMKLGIISDSIAWLSDGSTALHMIILADTWRMLPLVVVMLLAGLQTVSKNVLEAAVVDGAGAWKRFWAVYMPALKPMILVILVLRTIQAIRVFDIVYVLTKGGPANKTMVISFYSYFETFNYLNYGKGAAIAMVIAVLALVLSLLYFKVLRSKD